MPKLSQYKQAGKTAADYRTKLHEISQGEVEKDYLQVQLQRKVDLYNNIGETAAKVIDIAGQAKRAKAGNLFTKTAAGLEGIETRTTDKSIFGFKYGQDTQYFDRNTGNAISMADMTNIGMSRLISGKSDYDTYTAPPIPQAQELTSLEGLTAVNSSQPDIYDNSSQLTPIADEFTSAREQAPISVAESDIGADIYNNMINPSVDEEFVMQDTVQESLPQEQKSSLDVSVEPFSSVPVDATAVVAKGIDAQSDVFNYNDFIKDTNANIGEQGSVKEQIWNAGGAFAQKVANLESSGGTNLGKRGNIFQYPESNNKSVTEQTKFFIKDNKEATKGFENMNFANSDSLGGEENLYKFAENNFGMKKDTLKYLTHQQGRKGIVNILKSYSSGAMDGTKNKAGEYSRISNMMNNVSNDEKQYLEDLYGSDIAKTGLDSDSVRPFIEDWMKLWSNKWNETK
jgi:hypothetical protein